MQGNRGGGRKDRGIEEWKEGVDMGKWESNWSWENDDIALMVVSLAGRGS